LNIHAKYDHSKKGIKLEIRNLKEEKLDLPLSMGINV
jgi:hypothetical protein